MSEKKVQGRRSVAIDHATGKSNETKVDIGFAIAVGAQIGFADFSVQFNLPSDAVASDFDRELDKLRATVERQLAFAAIPRIEAEIEALHTRQKEIENNLDSIDREYPGGMRKNNAKAAAPDTVLQGKMNHEGQLNSVKLQILLKERDLSNAKAKATPLATEKK